MNCYSILRNTTNNECRRESKTAEYIELFFV